MDRYKVVQPIANGSFGTVSKGLNRITGEPVAIKTMKHRYFSWEECLSLREIKSLRKLTHPNLVKLKEVIRVNDELHLVFEYLDMNLYQFVKDRTRAFPEPQVRAILYQVLQGLAFLHKHGYFHRDIKPENLLLSEGICKIADFGQAREIRSKPPFTDYVSTRWYRAPEVLLKSSNYNSPVDLFALGCIMAELYNLRPFAPGSNENDQMFKLCSILGAPSVEQWPEGFKLASQCGYHFPGLPAQSLSVLVPGSCFEGVQLMGELFQWNPQRRITAAQSLGHAYFQNFLPILINPASYADLDGTFSDWPSVGKPKIKPIPTLMDAFPELKTETDGKAGEEKSPLDFPAPTPVPNQDNTGPLSPQLPSARNSTQDFMTLRSTLQLKPANYRSAFPTTERTVGLQNRAVPTYLGYAQAGVGRAGQAQSLRNGEALGEGFPVRNANRGPSLFPSLSRPGLAA